VILLRAFARYRDRLGFAGRDAPLADGDEVALMPPVSGG
jgi:molybdopterin converting factor small subunit